MQDLTFPILYLLRELLITSPNDDKLKDILHIFTEKYLELQIEKEKANKEINLTNYYRNHQTLPSEYFE